jgi:hypothetical protein
MLTLIVMPKISTTLQLTQQLTRQKVRHHTTLLENNNWMRKKESHVNKKSIKPE